MSLRSIFVLTAIFFSGVLLAACNQNNEQSSSAKLAVRPVKTIVVDTAKPELERTYSAVVLPARQVELSFRVPGRIVELPARSGKRVKKDEVMAQLDTRDFKAEIARLASQLKQAEAQMAALKSGSRVEDIAALQAGVAAAQAQVDAARDQLARTRQLFEKRIVTKAKLDSDLTALRVAEAQFNAKEQELLKGQSGNREEDIAAQEAAIQGLNAQMKTLNDKLSDATLRAPFDGVIAARQVENFSNVQAEQTIVTLQDLSTLDLTFDVPGLDVAKLAKIAELELKVSLDSVPDRLFEARQSEFSTQADAQTQTYRGRVSIDNPDGEVIFPGMTGSLIVTAKSGKLYDIIRLPITAIASQPDGEAFVWVVTKPENKLEKRAISAGEASGDKVRIARGLQRGDVVAIAGMSEFQENMIVRPVSSIGE